MIWRQKMKKIFSRADIILPNIASVDEANWQKWAVIACDQFTSEPKYWNEVEKVVGDAPSTLKMILPEIYLSDNATARTEKINADMKKICAENTALYPDSMIYVERVQSDGKLRRGIIGKIDLECYDYNKGSVSEVRATEGTVLERIPPRVAVRRDAELELPHVMILIDDPEDTVFSKLVSDVDKYEVAYDFDLMLGSGHIKGSFIDAEGMEHVENALYKFADPDSFSEKYNLKV